jgi:hypothetical protein
VGYFCAFAARSKHRYYSTCVYKYTTTDRVLKVSSALTASTVLLQYNVETNLFLHACAFLCLRQIRWPWRQHR